MKLRAKIYRRALEQLPREVELWKECVQLEQPEEAKLLLAKAVQCVPHCVDLWLALAKLETYKSAQGVLQRAREANPTELRIYMAAAKLEEAQGNKQIVAKIVKRALNNFKKHQVELTRDQWLQQAVLSEQSDSLQTCKTIVKETMNFGLGFDSYMDEKERTKQTRQIWLENVEACVKQGAIETGKALIMNAVALEPNKKSLWMRAQQLEQEFGTTETLCQLLKSGVTSAKHEFLFILFAKLLWKKMGRAEDALAALHQGLIEHVDSEDIIIALQKLLRELSRFDEAQKVITHALATYPTDRVQMQAVQLKREIGDVSSALEICEQALKSEFASFHKLWLIRAQLLEELGRTEDARTVYQAALKNMVVRSQRVVWLEAVKFEERQELFPRARTILQQARAKMPIDALIWLASIRLEITCDNERIAQHLLAKALQECPDSGALWTQAIAMEPQATRMRKSTDAVKHVNTDAVIFIAIGKIFWVDNKTEKARRFLTRATELDSDNGDAWLHLLKFEKQFGAESARENVRDAFRKAEPHHGEEWMKEVKKVANWRRDPLEVLEGMEIVLPKY